MEDVWGGGVVHNDDLPQVPAQLVEVLYVVPVVEDTGLTEEAGPEYAPPVQQVSHGVRVLGQRGREQHALV